MAKDKKKKNDRLDKLIESVNYYKTVKRDRNQNTNHKFENRKKNQSKSQNKVYLNMLQHMDKILQQSSTVKSSKNPDKVTKSQVRQRLRAEGKLQKQNLGVPGLHSIQYYNQVRSTTKNLIEFAMDNYGITKISQLKPTIIDAWIDHKKSSGTAKDSSIRTYVGNIKKFAECSVKAGINQHRKLVQDRHIEQLENRSLANRTRGGVEEGGIGYTLAHAEKMIEAADKYMSPLESAYIKTLAYGALRKESANKLRFEHIDTERGIADMTQKNMNKNNRGQIARLYESANEALKELKESGLFKDSDKVFGLMSDSQKYSVVERAAEYAGLPSYGLHAFRHVTVEYLDEKLSDKDYTKSMIADGILEYVNADPRLNPIVEKREPVLDENGKFKRDKNGNVITKKKLGPDGHVVMGPRWTKEELLEHRKDFLINMFIAEQLGHNRSDANYPYRFTKEMREIAEIRRGLKEG